MLQSLEHCGQRSEPPFRPHSAVSSCCPLNMRRMRLSALTVDSCQLLISWPSHAAAPGTIIVSQRRANEVPDRKIPGSLPETAESKAPPHCHRGCRPSKAVSRPQHVAEKQHGGPAHLRSFSLTDLNLMKRGHLASGSDHGFGRRSHKLQLAGRKPLQASCLRLRGIRSCDEVAESVITALASQIGSAGRGQRAESPIGETVTETADVPCDLLSRRHRQ